MKMLILTLCMGLVLTGLPAPLSAGQITMTKPSRVVTTAILGVTFGALLGAAVAGLSASSSAAPIAIGAGAGLVLGVGLALMTPTSEAEEQSRPGLTGGDAGPGPRGDRAEAFR
jgi:hypothetical protein